MSSRLNSSFNMMRKKSNVTDGMKKESLFGDSKDWRKLQATRLDRPWQLMRLQIQIHISRISLMTSNFLHQFFHNLLYKFHSHSHLHQFFHLLPYKYHSHCLLPISQFHVLCPSHGSLLTKIGMFITWEKWKLCVLIVGLFTGHLRSWPNL